MSDPEPGREFSCTLWWSMQAEEDHPRSCAMLLMIVHDWH